MPSTCCPVAEHTSLLSVPAASSTMDSVAVLRKLFCLSLVSWSVIAVADPPAGYYATAEGKAGTELFQALHSIIDHHTVVTYSSGTVPALEVLDEDPTDANSVVLI